METTPDQRTGGAAMPSPRGTIEIHVGTLRQMFNAMDPAPFRDRDLDPAAEAFIVESGRELPAGAPLALVVHLDRQAGAPGDVGVLRGAVHEFFRDRAVSTRRRLRQLFRVGRISLLISLVFLAATVAAGDFVAGLVARERLGEILKEGLLIGGWVAMWRPLEIFLYEWWPIRAEARLYDRLGAMDVRVVSATPAGPGAALPAPGS